MKSRSSATLSGTKQARANYGDHLFSQPGREKSEQPVLESGPRNPPQTSAKTIPSDKIARHAYSIWEREGYPDGRDKEFWFRAEAELKTERSMRLKF